MNTLAKWIGGIGIVLLIILAAIYISAWVSFHTLSKKRQSETASLVKKFHEGYNADQLNQICEVVYGCSLSSEAREKWHTYVQQLRGQIGAFSTVKSSKVQVSIEPFMVRATYISFFEKTECTEVFVLNDFDRPIKEGRVAYGPLKILDYRVSIAGKQILAP